MDSMLLRCVARALLALAVLGCRGGQRPPSADAPTPSAATTPAIAPAAVAAPAGDVASTAVPPSAEGAQRTPFAELVAQLSESGGFFDSDNIISNETSYLHVLEALRSVGVRGGVYIGVGPDQNFSYIAAIRPTVAFMLDIRRDNMFEHLLFKSIFALARNRLEYMCLLFGKPVPGNVEAWNGRSIEALVAYLDSVRTDTVAARATQRAINAQIASFGLALSQKDLETADKYRAEFVAEGLDVQFSSWNRNNRSNYPTLRRLLLETDRSGRRANFLASEDAFAYVKSMQARNLIVPVVGNVAGDKAVVAIARYARDHGQRVSAFYLSNVEQYLFRDGLFDLFAENVKRLPRDEKSVIIRSYFGRFGMGHPLMMPGHTSTSMAQRMDAFVRDFDAGALRTYSSMVDRVYISP